MMFREAGLSRRKHYWKMGSTLTLRPGFLPMNTLIRPPRTVDLLLVAVAFIWGTSYGVVKGVLLIYPVLGLLALRFGITFALLSPALRGLRHVRWRERCGALGAGLLLLGIFLAETFGVS